jgi:hypothetical protein
MWLANSGKSAASAARFLEETPEIIGNGRETTQGQVGRDSVSVKRMTR